MMFGFGPPFAKLIRASEDNTDGQNRPTQQEEVRARLNQDCGVELEDDVCKEWSQVFERLDQADGEVDGRIDRKALVKWVSALDMQKTIEFEANLNITHKDLERLVSRADQNKDGFVDRCEFLEMVANRDRDLTKKQQSLLHQYLQVAAYAEEYSCCPPPFFIPCLTILQVAVFAYHINHFNAFHVDGDQAGISWQSPYLTCSLLIYNPNKRYECWRFLSYCLAHAGIQHLIFNMLMQLFVGLPLEASHGALRVAIVYFSGVLAGSLATSTIDSNVFLAGASGGVYALISAHLATLILNWREDIVIMRRRFRAGKAPSAKHGHIVRILRLTTVLLYGAIDTGLTVYNRHMKKNSSVKTSYIAHVSGAVAGFLIGIIVLKNRKVEHWETKLKVVSVVIYLFLMSLAILWNIFGNNVTNQASRGNSTHFADVYNLQHTCHSFI